MASEIKKITAASQRAAETHAANCISFLLRDQLAHAIDYCQSHRIDPPQCSLSAESPNANKLREKAKDMLSDVNWWQKRLKTKALRDFEYTQIHAGKVTLGISDEMLGYMTNKSEPSLL